LVQTADSPSRWKLSPFAAAPHLVLHLVEPLFETHSTLTRMNRFFAFVRDRIRNSLCIANRVWRDRRVPILARIFVVLAPLYWINPYDLIPDIQPTGHLDDITLGFLLVVMAL
jgi:uncharacterized membrane protein YkvA (DUF1232 family)